MEDTLDGREEFARDLARWAPLNAYLDTLGLPAGSEVVWVSLSEYETSDYGELGRVDLTKTSFEIRYLRNGQCETPMMPWRHEVEGADALRMADALLTLLVEAIPVPDVRLPLIPHGRYRFARRPPKFVRFTELSPDWLLFGMAEDLVEGTDVEVRRFSDGETHTLRVGEAVAERNVERRRGSGEGSTRFVVTTWRPLVIEEEA